MALLQISEPGLSAAPHQRRLAAGIDRHHHSLVATVRSGAETLPDHQGRYLLPSVVNYHASGLTVGYDARLNAAQDPANTISSVKRMMGAPSPIFKTVTRICRISCRPVKTACR